ncbi:hypothetical protein [Kangiella sp. HZ709]|uniref:hypothetical protein n=1 Tax=Kangiella sp. HZ709 TaxID=2666328 RepID=UPI0012AFA424|nr:hypothetical protein [Kangiella sp. HZ709]MRX27888.1 hypothetical protein [Kangiella sp. HZ709]
MIRVEKVPKVTFYCYLISIGLISLVMAEQFLGWQWFSRESKITILVIAAIIGVSGSIYSIAKQLSRYLSKK